MSNAEHESNGATSRSISILTASSFLAVPLVFGPPVVIAAVPFWSRQRLDDGLLHFGAGLLAWMVIVSVIGATSGLFALLLSKRAGQPTGSAAVAIGLNLVPMLWSIAAALVLL